MRRFAIILAATGCALVAAAAPAWAHVVVNPASAPKGSDAVLAFVVPNEKDPATTTKVKVQFPRDHPFPDVLVEAPPGWTAAIATFKLTKPIVTDDGSFDSAIDNVTWTATGTGIAVDHFQDFKVSTGLPDDADSLSFPTTQTYSDGSTVNWVQVTPPGGPTPDDPVPVLTLTEGSGSTTPTTAPGSTSTASASVKKSDVDGAKTIAIVGIVAGVLGLVAGIGGIAMSRRKPA